MRPPAVGTPRDLPDRMIRRSLRRPANLRDFLLDAVPHLAGSFEYGQARFVDREFVIEGWRRREADLAFELPYRREGEPGREALVYVLLEHQSDTDPLVPLRVFLLTAGCWARQWVEWEQAASPRQSLRLRPVLPIVLYTAARPWGSNTTLRDLLAGPGEFHPYAPDWGPVFWNLADRSVQHLLAGGAWLQFMAVMRGEDEPQPAFLATFREASLHVAPLHATEEVRWRELMDMLLTYATWRRPPAERDALVRVAEETNPVRAPEVRVMANTIAEAWMEEGLAKGRAQEAREMLRLLLEDRFGALPEPLLARIQSTADLDKLRDAARQVSRLRKVEDLRL